LSVIKVLELVGSSPDGFEAAVNQAVQRASETVEDISGIEVINFTADVNNDEVVQYRANIKVAFHVKG